jgi:hypothetical protein
MKLFLLGRQTSNPILNRLPAMSHLSSLPDAVDEPSCFILNLDDPAQQDQLLVQIRKHPLVCFSGFHRSAKSAVCVFIGWQYPG